MKLDERYMYTVVPRSPIRNLIKGKAIIKATNLQLSKDEVKACLKHGAVYRKFYCESNSERVTPSNLDRLHRKDHITEKQYEKLKSHESENPISEEEDTDELLKNGEEEQLFTDNESEETVPQPEDDSNDQESVEVESAETQEEQTETQFTFDTAGDFIKKDDEEQLCTGESEDDSNDQESVEVESAETEEPASEETETQEESKQLTQKEQAANTYNQRNNSGKKSKNKNKQKSQFAENKNSTN